MGKPLSTFGKALALAGVLAVGPAQAAYLPTPLTAIDGGTGLATLTAHGVMVGAGTGNVVMVGPGATAGVALVSGGASADPSFTTVVVAGGGTGLATLTNHAILIGQGTSNVAFAAAAADSIPLWQTSSADPTVTAINNCATALTYSTGTHTFGCAAGGGVSPTTATYTSTSPIAITATNLLTTIVSMATPAVSTINLPTAVQTAGFRLCVKDGTTNFASFNATVKSPTAGTIDGVAGATGVVMNAAHAELCFISDAANWWVE